MEPILSRFPILMEGRQNLWAGHPKLFSVKLHSEGVDLRYYVHSHVGYLPFRGFTGRASEGGSTPVLFCFSSPVRVARDTTSERADWGGE